MRHPREGVLEVSGNPDGPSELLAELNRSGQGAQPVVSGPEADAARIELRVDQRLHDLDDRPLDSEVLPVSDFDRAGAVSRRLRDALNAGRARRVLAVLNQIRDSPKFSPGLLGVVAEDAVESLSIWTR